MTGGKVDQMFGNVTCSAEPATPLSLEEMRCIVRKMSRPAQYVRMTVEQLRVVVNSKTLTAKPGPSQTFDCMMGFPIVIAGSDEDTMRILLGEKSIDLTKPKGIDPDEVRK